MPPVQPYLAAHIQPGFGINLQSLPHTHHQLAANSPSNL
jgi:hypothetical protein